MGKQINIRAETEADYEAITQVNDLAFGRENEGRLVVALREHEDFDPRLSLVAECQGEVIGHPDCKIIGHALFTPIRIQTPKAEHPTLGLGPIAVLPKHQKCGTGGKLIQVGHRIARDLGYTSVILLGHPSYYPRFGYRMAAMWGLTNPWGIHNEAFMAIELVDGSLADKAGLVVYPEAFDDAA